MAITNSPKLGYPIPGATISDTRFGDIQAVKSALLSLDDTVGNLPAVPGNATTTVAGLMSAVDKVKLDSVPEVYSKTETDDRIQAIVGAAPAALDTLVEIATQLASDESAVSALTTVVSNKANASHVHSVATTTVDGFLSSTDKVKLDGIASGATVYSHPANHAPSIITQDSNNRFVTDSEKAVWNAKQDAGTYATGTGSASGVNTGDQTLTSLGIPNVENKSSATIRSEITNTNVIDGLGFTPVDEFLLGASNGVATLDSNGLVPITQLLGLLVKFT